MAKKNRRNKTKKTGLPPGSLVYTGIPKERSAGISLLSFDETTVVEKTGERLDQVLSGFDRAKVNWINIDSLHDVPMIEAIGKHFNIHNLVLEDILNVHHASKIVDYDDHIFVILKLIRANPVSSELEMEHISLIMGDHYLVTFQETNEDPFNEIRDRILNKKGKVRERNTDYLFFLITDAIIDQYSEVMEEMMGAADDTEMELFESFDQDIIHKIIGQKKVLGDFRKTVLPILETYKTFFGDEHTFISRDYLNYFEDAYDHLLQINSNIQALRDSLSYQMDYYMSRLSIQMNQVMKTLTIIATVFIPLTFVAGVYGMNFHFMPELEWKWSYPVLLSLMLIAGSGMFLYMRRKKWF